MLKGLKCEMCNKSMTEIHDSGLKVTKKRYPIVNEDGTRTLVCEGCFIKYCKEKNKVIQVPMYKDGKGFENWKNIPTINLKGEIKERNKGGDIQE